MYNAIRSINGVVIAQITSNYLYQYEQLEP